MRRTFLALILTSMLAHADDAMVKIAVVDTGFDMKSKWSEVVLTPPKICPGQVYNFVNDKEMEDDHGHGTHIAGIIAKYAGQAEFCLVIMKYYDAKGNDINNLANTLKSFRKAIELNVDIINYSGGGIIRSVEECATVKEALDKGIIIVAAAGNESGDLNTRTYWPVLCDPRVVAVGSIYSYPPKLTKKQKLDRKLDQTPENKLPTSNFSTSPDISVEYEEGNDILSLLPHDQYGYMTGTSQATATMTGKLANHLYIMRKSKYGKFLLKKSGGWGK